MKKAYQKPAIAIENFVLNQFIAGSCTLKMNHSETCYEDWEDSGMSGASGDIKWQITVQNFFLDTYSSCFNVPDEETDGVCYHTQGSPLFQS